jgi:hypothetical protein
MARCLDWFSWALTVQLSFGQLSIVVFLTLHSSSMHTFSQGLNKREKYNPVKQNNTGEV